MDANVILALMPLTSVGGSAPAPYRVAGVFLFDTCTHKCGYCWLAESGQVLDFSQLEPYRDPEFIRKVQHFFLSRTTGDTKWLLACTGGEPLMAPNLARLFDPILEAGNKIAMYTALLLGVNHPGFQFLMKHDRRTIECIVASFHPEAELDEPRYFEKIRMLKDRGHNVFLRMIGHPDRLHRLADLTERCREMDIPFDPTPLYSHNYPDAYTPEQKEQLVAHVSSLSQRIRLEGGLDTTGLECYGGSRIINVSLQTGNITPCSGVRHPSLGNLFEDRLELYAQPIQCPQPGVSCLCELHFQQNVVIGAGDREIYEQQLRGFTPPRAFDVEIAALTARGMRFHRGPNKGIGEVRDDARLFYTFEEVKENFRKNHGLPRTTPPRDLREMTSMLGKIAAVGSGVKIRKGPPVRIVTEPKQWSYAAAIPFDAAQDLDEVWVKVRARVQAGEAGFGLLNRAGTAFHERFFLAAAPDAAVIYLRSAEPADLAMLIIENSYAAGQPTDVELLEVAVLAKPSAVALAT